MRLSCADSFCSRELFQSATRICWPVTNLYCWIEMETSGTRPAQPCLPLVTFIVKGTRFIIWIETIIFIIAEFFFDIFCCCGGGCGWCWCDKFLRGWFFDTFNRVSTEFSVKILFPSSHSPIYLNSKRNYSWKNSQTIIDYNRDYYKII